MAFHIFGKSKKERAQEQTKEEMEARKLSKKRTQLQGLYDRNNIPTTIIACIALSVMCSLFAYPFLAVICRDLGYEFTSDDYVGVILLITISWGCLFLWQYNSNKEKAVQLEEEVFELELNLKQRETDEDLFRNAINISYKYLNQYYAQTREQAEKGFFITVIVAVFGAILILGGVVFLLFGNSGKLTPAYITCASGAVTEFISAVFFYLYNKTITSMNSYHDKLVLSQNIAFALRVADSLSEDKKDDAKLAIISELVKDVNAQMMKSDGDADGTPEKGKPPASDAETPSG